RTGRSDATLARPPTNVSRKFYDWCRWSRQLQPLVCQARSLGQGFEFRPHDGGVLPLVEGALGEPAIRPRNDALASDNPREGHDPLGDRLGMLHHRGRVGDDPGDEYLALRWLEVLPHPPLGGVTRSARI